MAWLLHLKVSSTAGFIAGKASWYRQREDSLRTFLRKSVHSGRNHQVRKHFVNDFAKSAENTLQIVRVKLISFKIIFPQEIIHQIESLNALK